MRIGELLTRFATPRLRAVDPQIVQRWFFEAHRSRPISKSVPRPRSSRDNSYRAALDDSWGKKHATNA